MKFFYLLCALKALVACSSIISMGDNNHQLREFDTTTGRVTATYAGHDATVVTHDYSPDGKYLVSATVNNAVYLFDASTQKQLKGSPIRLVAGGVLDPNVAVSINNTFAVVTGNKVIQYDIASGKQLTSATVDVVINLLGVAYSPDGSVFATVEEDGSTVNNWGNIRIFNAKTGDSIKVIQKVAINGLKAIAFSPNGKYFAVTPDSANDQYLRVYNADTYALYKKYTDPKGPYGDMRCVSFSSDSSHVIAGGADKMLREYEVTSGKMSQRIKSSSGGWIHGCDYSGDSKYIAFSENETNDARIIDASTGRDVDTVKVGAVPYALKYKPGN